MQTPKVWFKGFEETGSRLPEMQSMVSQFEVRYISVGMRSAGKLIQAHRSQQTKHADIPREWFWGPHRALSSCLHDPFRSTQAYTVLGPFSSKVSYVDVIKLEHHTSWGCCSTQENLVYSKTTHWNSFWFMHQSQRLVLFRSRCFAGWCTWNRVSWSRKTPLL